MKIENHEHRPIQFAADVQSDATPEAVAGRNGKLELFARLQDRLVRQLLGDSRSSILRGNLHQAANEAAAMAWTTPYPLLMMPALFEEKTRLASLRAARQKRIRLQSQRLIELAL